MKEINEVRERPMDIVRMFIAKHEQLVRGNCVIVDYGLKIEEIKPDFVVDARKQ